MSTERLPHQRHQQRYHGLYYQHQFIAIVAIISIAVIITTIVRRGPSQLLLCGQRELDWWVDTILFCSSILLHWIHGSSQTQNWWACSENLDNLLNIYDIMAILKAITIHHRYHW